MPAPTPSHRPTRYALLFASAAELAASTNVFQTGDTAGVPAANDPNFIRTYVYDRASTSPVDDLVVINGPGSVGRWLLDQYKGSYALQFTYTGATLDLVTANDPSLHMGAGATLSIVRNGPGDYTITLLSGSVLRPSVADAYLSALCAGVNADAYASISAFWDGANTIHVRTAHVGLDGAASSPTDYDLSLFISIA